MKITEDTLKAIAKEAMRILNESSEDYNDDEENVDTQQAEVDSVTDKYTDQLKLPRGTMSDKEAQAQARADMRSEFAPEREEPEDLPFNSDDYEEEGFGDDAEDELSKFDHPKEPDDEDPQPTEYEGVPIEVVDGRYRMVAQESEPRIVLTSGKLNKIKEAYEDLWSTPYDQHREWAMSRGEMDFTGMTSDIRLEDLPIKYDVNEAIKRAIRKLLG